MIKNVYFLDKMNALGTIFQITNGPILNVNIEDNHSKTLFDYINIEDDHNQTLSDDISDINQKLSNYYLTIQQNSKNIIIIDKIRKAIENVLELFFEGIILLDHNPKNRKELIDLSYSLSLYSVPGNEKNMSIVSRLCNDLEFSIEDSNWLYLYYESIILFFY